MVNTACSSTILNLTSKVLTKKKSQKIPINRFNEKNANMLIATL